MAFLTELTSLLRSPLVEEILRLVLLERGEWTADEVASRTDTPYPTVTKELRRMERAGVVITRTVGRTKFFSAASDDPATRALSRALAAATGGDMAKKKSKKKDDKKKKK